jgi:WD40 repeat protein
MRSAFPLLLASGGLTALLGLLSLAPAPVPAAASPVASRDGQGDLLPPPAVARLGTVRLRTTEPINTVAWSPDGRHLAVGGYYGTARVWEAGTGRRIPLPVPDDVLWPEPPAPKRLWARPIAIQVVWPAGRVARFSPDGSVLVTASQSLHVYRCKDLTAQPFRTFDLGGSYGEVALSTDGRLAAIGGSPRDSTLRVYNLAASKVLWTSDAHQPNSVGAVAFSPDGRQLASADCPWCGTAPIRPGIIRLWDAWTGKETGRLEGLPAPPNSLVFTRWGDTLISSSSDGTVRFWDLATRKETRRINGPAQAMTLSADGRRLVGCSSSSPEVRVYDAGTGKLLRTLDCGSAVWAAGLSPDGRTVATGQSRSLRLWDVATGKEVQARAGHHDAVFCVRFSPDGRTLASRSADQTVRVWERDARRQRLVLPIGDSPTYPQTTDSPPSASLAFSPDGRTLAAVEGTVSEAVGVQGPHVLYWDLTHPAAPRRLRVPVRSPFSVGFSPDGRVRVTGTVLHRGVHLWDDAGALLAELTDPGPHDPNEPGRAYRAVAAVFSPDDRTLAVADGPRVALWDFRSRRHLRTLAALPHTAHVAFSPTGHLVAATGEADSREPRSVQVWEVATGRLVATLRQQARAGDPNNHLHGLAFSPDGRLVAAGDARGNVRCWDLATGTEVACWAGHDGAVYSVDFAPDGGVLASGGIDTTVLLWDTRGLRTAVPPGAGRLDDWTAALAEEDGAKAYAAVWALVGRGDAAVSQLRATLRPVPQVDAGAIRRWIAELDAPTGPRRDQASAALGRMGQPAERWLRQASANPSSAEVKRRLARLLNQIEGGAIPGERQQQRGLLVLELIGSGSARAALAELATGEPDAHLTRAAKAACDRLARRGR